jgi:gamma-butyrobetaine dioxygenase
MSVIDQIFGLFRTKGNGAYFGEAITETQHALQCAFLAKQVGAGSDLIVAALLHDIGHLLHNLGEDIAQQGIDGRHEQCGAMWLSRYFSPSVVNPVRLHVAAKRYLCTVEPNYLTTLSDASQLSLQLQGGPMSADEVQTFEATLGFREAIALRRWDDEAKIPELQIPDLEHYRADLEASLIRADLDALQR